MITGYLFAWSAVWVVGSLALLYHLWRRSGFSRVARGLGTLLVLVALAFSWWGGFVLRAWSTTTRPPEPSADRRDVETRRVTRTLRLPGFTVVRVDHTDADGETLGRQERTILYLPLTLPIIATTYGFLLARPTRRR
ncbi:MAG: hypothetical protein ACODAE_03965 [Gemmatimonadota bacterium]